MMKSKIKILFLIPVLAAIIFVACSKYKDPPNAVPNPALTNHYCNDPRSVNYNRGFPGIPDSTVCTYPVDSFLGNWTFHDTVYLPSGDTQSTQIMNLHFTSTEDTLRSHLAIAGWCTNGTSFYATANKYYAATVDTFPGSSLGQFLCTTTDTVVGNFNYFSDSAMHSINLKVDLTITNAGGTTYHRGTAIKQ